MEEKFRVVWERALELEKVDELKQAEDVILAVITHLDEYAHIARLHEVRMMRLKAMGDKEGAMTAFHRSNHWMTLMASGATSGGEGLALSCEAREHRERLVKKLGTGFGDGVSGIGG